MDHCLSVIIPAYNEGRHIGAILERLRQVRLPFDMEMQVVVVDDGSQDDTAGQVERFMAQHSPSEVLLLRHKSNQGKGMAIRTGLSRVRGKFVVIQDGDLELDPNDFVPMLRRMVQDELSVLYGSRFLGKTRKTYAYRSFYMGTRILSLTVNLLYGQHITDEPTCYKMFRTALLQSLPLKCRGFEFCPEVTARVCRLGYIIEEVPIAYTPRTIEEGKKIRARDGLIALWTLLKYRFYPLSVS